MTTTADLLNEYAASLRGPWGGIDGRSEKHALDRLAEAIRTFGAAELERSEVLRLRNSLDVCSLGEGHWTEFCEYHKDQDLEAP